MHSTISVSSNQNLTALFFGNAAKPNISTIIKTFLKTFECSTNIKLGVYPFATSEKITIPLDTIYLKLLSDIISPMNNDKTNRIDVATDFKKSEAIYNGAPIDITNCFDIYFQSDKANKELYCLLNLTLFEDKHEESVRRFCFSEVGKQIDHILANNKKMSKKKTKSKTTFIKR